MSRRDEEESGEDERSQSDSDEENNVVGNNNNNNNNNNDNSNSALVGVRPSGWGAASTGRARSPGGARVAAPLTMATPSFAATTTTTTAAVTSLFSTLPSAASSSSANDEAITRRRKWSTNGAAPSTAADANSGQSPQSALAAAMLALPPESIDWHPRDATIGSGGDGGGGGDAVERFESGEARLAVANDIVILLRHLQVFFVKKKKNALPLTVRYYKLLFTK